MKEIFTKLSIVTTLIITNTAFAQTGSVGVNTPVPGSTLDVRGSVAAQYNATTSTSYNMSATDFHVAYNGSANATFNLPPAQTGSSNFKGRLYTIKNNTAFKITTVAAGAETIGGVTSVDIPAGNSLQLINTGLTGSAATWEIVSNTNTSVNGCAPGYHFAKLSSNNSAGMGSVIPFNTSVASNNIAIDTSTSRFTLLAGNTYDLEAVISNDFANATGGGIYAWYNAANGLQLTSGIISETLPVTSSTHRSNQQIARVLITPSVDTQVQVRCINCVGGATVNSAQSYVMIKQLNACNSGSGGGSLTASNGLTATGSDVKLGGTLNQATDIATAGNNLNVTGMGKVMVGTNTVPTGGTNSKVIVDNGTTNGAIQIKDGTEADGKVLTSDANGVATWKNAGFGVPNTQYIWNNNLGGPNTNHPLANDVVVTYGPYTVGKTGWYQSISRWFYTQNTVSYTTPGVGYAWMQINTVATNAMDAAALNVLSQPFEERKVLDSAVGSSMVSGSLLYLQANTNYYVHVFPRYASRTTEQIMILTYLQ